MDKLEPTEEQQQRYNWCKAAAQASEWYWELYADGKKGARCFLDSQKFPDDPINNEMRGFLEWYDFKYLGTGAGTGSYFAYLTKPFEHITTWMGEPLAKVTWLGPFYQCPGWHQQSTRRNFRAVGIDGHEYAGTAYDSSGDYVRMRRVKGRTARLAKAV